MGDLYSILGVSRDASLSAIRRAFRKKVRSCHPDSGGSVEAFNELKTAYDVLSDPDRRRRYDETGQLGDRASGDPHRTKIIEILAAGLDHALLKINASRTFRRADVIAVTQECLITMRSEAENRKKNFEAALDQANSFKNRFRASNDANLMEIVVARRILACQNQIAILTNHVRNIGEALDVLRGTELEDFLQIAESSSPNEDSGHYTATVSPLLDLNSLIRFK